LDLLEILLIALGLAMDAFSVSVVQGMESRENRISNGLKMAGSFGIFQSLMPIIGWVAGLQLIDLISGFDHWIAFILLAFVGGKMIYEAIFVREKGSSGISASVLLVLSIATSIDALAVGLSFSLLSLSIATPVIVIGVVAFILSFLGFYFGSNIGQVFDNKIQVLGGLILIGIGIKILLEHML
jgi:putative Mn2+ efflux pump MntP